MKNILGGFAAPGDGGGGGADICHISVSGGGYIDLITSTSNGSGEANTWCVNYIAANPGKRCGYDCMHDGFGQ